jgi:SAM-dependent methyltransferase
MTRPDLPDYVRDNREHWTRANARFTDAGAEQAWAESQIRWGVWQTPESEVKALPDVAGKDVIELGCGTAYFGARIKRQGARRVLGIDVTPAQLDTARRMNEQFGLGLELIEGNAESVPEPDASFDLAVSEYGASIWCDPYLWIPEAARLLRPGGELVFMCNSVLSILCTPDVGQAEERLLRPQLGIHRLTWDDGDPSAEFHLGHGDLIRLLRGSGFGVLDLIELFAPSGAQDHPYYDTVGADWARRWPAEEIWRARKQA